MSHPYIYLQKIDFVYYADENGDHKLAYTVFWLFYYTNHQNRIFVQKILIYFGKVWRKSNMCIIRYGWLIPLYLFIPLVCSTIFLIIKNSCFREELSDIPFFFRHNCNKSLWKNIFFVSLQLRTSHLVCAPPQLKLSPSPTTCAVDYFQRLRFFNSRLLEKFTGKPKIVSHPTSSQEILKHKSTFTFTLRTIYEVNGTAQYLI